MLFHPVPGVDFTDGFALLERNTSILCIGIIVGIIALTHLLHKFRFLGSVLTAILVSGGVWFWMKRIKEEAENIRWETEKRRGETAQLNLIPESVEWMNTLLKIIWGLVNPEMFASMADTLEDVMQASVPGIIVHSRYSSINIRKMLKSPILVRALIPFEFSRCDLFRMPRWATWFLKAGLTQIRPPTKGSK